VRCYGFHEKYRNIGAVGAETAFGPARWARLAVALVNTAPGQRHGDTLSVPGDLRAILLAHDEPEPVTIDDRDLADARAARAELAAVFLADDPAELAARLNRLLARTARPRLAAHDGAPLHLHLDAPGSSWGQWLAATGAMALALLVAEHGTSVLGQCAAPGCHHAVIRVGRGPARRYCDSRCAARRRVAARRARARST
jgi:predicted RNA-binding Zn ribbon-like protein